MWAEGKWANCCWGAGGSSLTPATCRVLRQNLCAASAGRRAAGAPRDRVTRRSGTKTLTFTSSSECHMSRQELRGPYGEPEIVRTIRGPTCWIHLTGEFHYQVFKLHQSMLEHDDEDDDCRGNYDNSIGTTIGRSARPVFVLANETVLMDSAQSRSS